MTQPMLKLATPLLRQVDLNLTHIYVSPLGRRCMLQAGSEGYGGWYTFRYLDGSGESFSIMVANLRFMRRAP